MLSSSIIYLLPVNPVDFGARFWCRVLLSPNLNDTFGAMVWAARFAWTLLLQGLLAAGLYLLFRRANRFWLVPVAAMLAIVVAGLPLILGAVWLDARAVPRLYRGREGPAIEWPEVCRAGGAHLLAPADSRYGSLERSGRAWMVSHATDEPMILFPEGCRRIAYAGGGAGQDELRDRFKRPLGPDIHWEDAGLRYSLFDAKVPANRYRTWSPEYGYQFTPDSLAFHRQFAPGGCVVFGFDSPGERDVPAESGARCPVLSGDSAWLASFGRAPYSEGERRVEIVPLRGKGPLEVDISKAGQGFVALQGLSAGRSSLLIRRQSSRLLQVHAPDLEARGFSHEYLEIGFDGQIVWRLPRTGGADDGRLVLDAPNWVWWQSAYLRTPGCCRIEWNAGGRPGSHTVARGRNIVSVSLDPAGRLIAVSVSDRHWTGEVPDSVYVIRTSDGGEVFRQFLPALTQPRVQFLGPGFLAYTGFDGADGFVRVVKVPASAN